MSRKIAFICIHNSCRSQIAEALGKYYYGDKFELYSAGTIKKEKINEDAVRIIKELYGIDMLANNQHSKLIDEIPFPDIMISMGCGVKCPLTSKAFDGDWGLNDPTGKSDEEFKEVIKQIETNLHSLVKNI